MILVRITLTSLFWTTWLIMYSYDRHYKLVDRYSQKKQVLTHLPIVYWSGHVGGDYDIVTEMLLDQMWMKRMVGMRGFIRGT